jgi:hypothetical protein
VPSVGRIIRVGSGTLAQALVDDSNG